MTTGQMIKQLRKAAKMSQEELARKVGYTDRSSIAKIESDKAELTESKIKQISEIFGITPAELLGIGTPSVATEFVTFPILGEVAAGYEHFAEYDDFGDIDIPASWLKGRPQSDYFILRISGDSMYPTYQDGDLVLVLRQSTMNYSGQIGVVVYDDNKATLKRIEYVMGEDWMRLVPINPNFPPQTIRDEKLEHCRVLGIAKMVIREVH